MAKLEFSQPPKGDDEEWRELPECGVWASSLGRIWVGSPVGRVAPWSESGGYLVVRAPGINGGKTVGVHRLVAHAFHGECPDGMCVDHIDCNQFNNRPENLQYVTPSENTRLYWQRKKELGDDTYAVLRAADRANADAARFLEENAPFMAALKKVGLL